MKISCLAKTDPSKILVLFVEGEPWREIHKTIFGRHPVFPTNVESLKDLEFLLEQLEYEGARRYALRRLAMKSQPTIELKKHLKNKNVSEKTIDRILEEMIRLGYCNDSEWMENYIRHMRNRHKGPKAISAGLKSKGVNFKNTDSMIEELSKSKAQKQSIQHLLNSRYGKRLGSFLERQKVMAALLRRGFDWEIVQQVLVDNVSYQSERETDLMDDV